MARTTGTQKTNLFDADTLYEATSLGAQQPVICLGKTFATDDERREYFRTVLSEKLPELKKLDGYPIGEDDDIINLSDPPYYTACPNPWLNDFVAEWEAEKPQLEKEGLRKADFNVTDPYASDVSEGKNNPIYNAHSYHTKVPHPAIMRYILHYTQPGDIILDGFAGTGMTGVAAQMCGHPDINLKNKIEDEFTANGYEKPAWGTRHAICGDLSPIASFIAYNYNTPVDVKKFEHDANKILDDVEKECGWMYETNHVKEDGTIEKGRINYTVWSDCYICPDCGSEIIYYNEAYDKNNNAMKKILSCPDCGALHEKKELTPELISKFDEYQGINTQQIKQVPVLINYSMTSGGRFFKEPDSNDLDIISKIENQKITNWIPSLKMMNIGSCWGDTWRAGYHIGVTNVYHFYVKRSLYVLSIFYNKIKSPQLYFLFNSMLAKLTKMNRYMPQHGSRALVGPMANTMYLPPLFVENEIISQFEFQKKKIAKAFEYTKRNIVQTCSSTNKSIKDNSIDYIFVDPPFGANIMYSELNFLNESWLRMETNNEKEAIENSSQHKNHAEYLILMQKSFNNFYIALKPGRWMTVEFSNTQTVIWNLIKESIQKAGFIIMNVATINKERPGLQAMIGSTAVNEDLIISCYKPGIEFEYKINTQDKNSNIWTFIDEQLKHLQIPEIINNKVYSVTERNPKILYDRLITFFLMRNLSFPNINSSEFQDELRRRYREEDGMIFTSEELPIYLENKKKFNSIKQISFYFDIVITESDAIQWCKYKLEKTPLKYNDLQPDFRKANAMTRKGEDPIELKTVLEENFIRNDDDTWRVPDLNEAKDRETLRTKALLKEFARYVEDLESGKVRSLKTVRQQAVLAGFKDCYAKKDYELIVKVAEHIPQDLLNEDEMLLNYYDIATDKVGI